MIGRVVSTKMQKTVTVLVEGRKTHPLYNKSFLQTKKYLVDDQMGVKLGQIVEFEKIRPISKRKHWQIKKVLGVDVVALGKEALKIGAAEAIAEVLPEEPKELAAETVTKVGEPKETAEVVEVKKPRKKRVAKKKEETK